MAEIMPIRHLNCRIGSAITTLYTGYLYQVIAFIQSLKRIL